MYLIKDAEKNKKKNLKSTVVYILEYNIYSRYDNLDLGTPHEPWFNP